MPKCEINWELIGEYVSSFDEAIVYNFNDLIAQITNHLSYLKKEYGWEGDLLLSTAIDRERRKRIFTVSYKDDYGIKAYCLYEIKIYICDNEINNIYTYNNKYYRCLIFNGRSGLCLWQPMTKILWFYVKKSNKKQFWMDCNYFEEV